MLNGRDLYDELNDLRESQEDYDNSEPEDGFEPLDDYESDRLEALEALADEIGEDTLRHGETLIPVDDFESYARDYAEGQDYNLSSQPWPLSHIDWEAAAAELAENYTEVNFDGTDYYVLSQ